MRMSKVIGELIAYIFIFMMLLLSILMRIQPILMKIINIVFNLIKIIRNLSLALVYRALPMFYKLKFKLTTSKSDLLINYYRMISSGSKKVLVIKDPKLTYEINLEAIDMYRRVEDAYLLREEGILKKYRDKVDSGFYSKYELLGIKDLHDKELKDLREAIDKNSAKIFELEKDVK
ncbi:hypothetical protein OLEAN_C24880 [Oleispira antarctica RB-8]|uniref:Uncharacterized protein n=1 Tax=Oleispira antarctica RB-8 TaxID=698738 RepID=R4YUG8_OLEAN|nr:hypothetical protein OLEAN_C24880 [Oleispira antarctica RB-8]